MLGRIRKEVRDVSRVQHIVKILIGHGLGYYLHELNLRHLVPIGKRLQPDTFSKRHDLPKRARFALEELGGVFIKLGQFLSLRPDLIPHEYADEFRNLQDNVRHFPTAQARKIIEQELKRPIETLFSHFPDEPIAAASVAQVYRAVLKSGEIVAVKVQRPGIEELFESDFDILYRLALLAKKRMRHEYFDPLKVVKEFESYTRSELDFLKEAHNIAVIRKALAHNKKVVIPKPYLELSTSKLLVMEFIDGTEVNHLPSNITRKQRAELANTISNMVFSQIFEHGYFHADPHPANIFVMKSRKIALLDFGIVGFLNSRLRQHIGELFVALINGDAEGLAQSFLDLGIVEGQVDKDELAMALRDALGEYYGIGLDRIEMKVVFNKLLHVAQQFNIHLPANFILFGKAMVTLEGVGEQLYSEFNLVETARPYVRQLRHKQTSLRELAKELSKSRYKLAANIVQLPGQVTDILSRLQDGELKVQLQHEDVRNLTAEISKATTRVTYGLLVAALIIATTFLQLARPGPTIFNIPILTLAILMFTLYIAFRLLRS